MAKEKKINTEFPSIEHFDYIISEYKQKINALEKNKKNPEIRRKINSLITQKCALEIAKESYLDSFET